MTTTKKGKIGENIVLSMFKDYGLTIKKTAMSGSLFGDGDLIFDDTEGNLVYIDVKNYSTLMSKKLNTTLKKIEMQAKDTFDSGAVVDFDEAGTPYIHMKLELLLQLLS